MKYVIIDQRKDGAGDMFSEETDSISEALRIAECQYDHLTKRENAVREIFVLNSVNPDEDAADHFDGDIIWANGECI